MTPDASKAKAKRHRDNWKKKALAFEAENKLLREANCYNCAWLNDDGIVCDNPVDQCGEGDRLMWKQRRW